MYIVVTRRFHVIIFSWSIFPCVFSAETAGGGQRCQPGHRHIVQRRIRRGHQQQFQGGRLQRRSARTADENIRNRQQGRRQFDPRPDSRKFRRFYGGVIKRESRLQSSRVMTITIQDAWDIIIREICRLYSFLRFRPETVCNDFYDIYRTLFYYMECVHG